MTIYVYVGNHFVFAASGNVLEVIGIISELYSGSDYTWKVYAGEIN